MSALMAHDVSNSDLKRAYQNWGIPSISEIEIATLVEFEREIFTAMEGLEDALGLLHQKAKSVRSALRERGAELAQASQRRRRGSVSTLDAKIGTPASLKGG